MPLQDAGDPAAPPEFKRQIFFDPAGWRARITDAFIAILAISLCGAATVIIVSIFVAPRLSVPVGPPSQPVAGSVVGKSFAPTPHELPIAVAQYPSELAPASKVMRLAFFSGDDGALLSLKQHVPDLDAVVPLWLGLRSGSKGTKLLINRKQNETLDWLREHANNVSIYPELTTDLNDSELLALFADAENRSALRDELVQYLSTYGLAGIVFDAARVPTSSCGNAAIFLRSLRSKLSEDNRKTFALVEPSAEGGCLREISSAVDYVISATHDENIERHSLGALSSQGWFEGRLRRLIAAVQPSKLIVTIGAFASDVSWAGSSTIIPVQRAWDILHRERARLELDGDLLNPTFAYVGKDGGEHRVWLLDGVTAFNQAKIAMTVPVAGIAVWRLGLEDPGVWHSIGRGRSPDAAALRALGRPEPGYGNYRFVEGALFSAGPDFVGHRTLVYDLNLGLVISEEITRPPLRGEQGIWRSSDPKAIALTFDDGPDPRFTGKILDILKDKGVRATFYVIGRQALGSPDLIRRIYAEGHDIGSHSFSHPNPFTIDSRRLQLELNATQRVFELTLGIQTHLFRPPYASTDFGYLDAGPQVIQTVTQLGYVIGGMDTELCDFCGVSVDWMVDDVMDGVFHQSGRIILFHDGGGDRRATLATLPILIDKLRAAGFHFVTMHEMGGLSREQLMPPWHPLAFLAAMETETWRKLSAVVRYLSERGPGVIIGTIVLGIARLSLIAILAISQFWRRSRQRDRSEPYRGSVDVLVPAYNEEKVVCKTVEFYLIVKHGQRAQGDRDRRRLN